MNAKGWLVLTVLLSGFTALPAENPGLVYQIQAELLPERNQLLATEVLTWANPAAEPISELRFHLYYNAFRDRNSTFMNESGAFRWSTRQLRNKKFGFIRIVAMRVISGEDLTRKIRFLAPDDGNADDRTVMAVSLESPLEPGQSIQIETRFELTMPEIFARSGRSGDYFFFGQWFPKIGVLEADGSWNCHQYHAFSEFFSDYGSYRVTLTLPERFVVGASGRLISRQIAAGRKTLVFTEEDIHDFAWTAYPKFRRIVERIRLKGNSQDTEIIMLLSPGHELVRSNYLGSLKFALRFFADAVFPYPYQTITLVDPPLRGAGSDGMEYPTLITAGYLPLVPGNRTLAELVTIHEFGHQYWYGLVGNDEFREAWLDEGVNTFFEMAIMDDYYRGANAYLDLGLLAIPDWVIQRARAVHLKPLDRVNTLSWKFINGGYYGANVYNKAGIFLRSLGNYIGRQKMFDFFKFYAMKYRFRHPRSADFIAAFNEFTGQDFNWAFEQFINGETNLDQAVFHIDSELVQATPAIYRNEAVFARYEGYFPVDLLIRLQNGKEIRYLWKEREKWKRIVFTDSAALDAVLVDPELKIPLDRNLANNSRFLRGTFRSGIAKMALTFAALFQNLFAMILL